MSTITLPGLLTLCRLGCVITRWRRHPHGVILLLLQFDDILLFGRFFSNSSAFVIIAVGVRFSGTLVTAVFLTGRVPFNLLLFFSCSLICGAFLLFTLFFHAFSQEGRHEVVSRCLDLRLRLRILILLLLRLLISLCLAFFDSFRFDLDLYLALERTRWLCSALCIVSIGRTARGRHCYLLGLPRFKLITLVSIIPFVISLVVLFSIELLDILFLVCGSLDVVLDHLLRFLAANFGNIVV